MKVRVQVASESDPFLPYDEEQIKVRDGLDICEGDFHAFPQGGRKYCEIARKEGKEKREKKRNCRQRLSLTQDECTDFMVGEFKELLEIIKQVFRRTQEEEGAAARATTSEQ